MEHNCLITRYDPRDWHLGDGNIKLKGIGNPDWTGNCWFMERQKFSYDNECCIIYMAQESFDAQVDRLIENGEVDASIIEWFNMNGYMDIGSDGKAHFHSSERFIAYNTGNGFNGNSGQDPWIAMRTYGVIPWKDWPFDATITETTYFTKPPQPLFDKGLLFLATIGGKNSIQYHWVSQSTDTSRTLIDSARITAPVGFGVATNDGWNQVEPTPPVLGTPANHGILNINSIPAGENILDHYVPFIKTLVPSYPIPQSIQGVVSISPPPPAPTLPPNPTTVQTISWLQALTAWLRRVFDPGSLGAARSPQWSGVEKAFVAQHPVCEVCGTKNKRQVHHISPFHLDPEKELDPENLITLCQPHHLLFGHFMNWKSFDADVRANAATWKDYIDKRP